MKKIIAPKPQKVFHESTEKKKLNELLKNFGSKKKLPRGYRLQALIALSYYPELKDVQIEFRFKETDTILSTKPAPATVPLPAKERKYLIYISKKTNASKEPVMIKNLTFNMQVGVIAHELGHVVDFLSKNSLEVIKAGALYGFKAYQHKIECHVDRIAIRHGFAYQLLEYANYVAELKQKFPDEKYYQDYNSIYLSPAQLQQKINSLKLYTENDSK